MAELQIAARSTEHSQTPRPSPARNAAASSFKT